MEHGLTWQEEPPLSWMEDEDKSWDLVSSRDHSVNIKYTKCLLLLSLLLGNLLEEGCRALKREKVG